MPARNDIICRRFIHVEDCTAMEEKEIPKAVISRLPKYYRYLGILMDEGVERVSSADLSRHMHATASQIRQDLNHFGGFGQQGYGYNVKYLYESIGLLSGRGGLEWLSQAIPALKRGGSRSLVSLTAGRRITAERTPAV